MTQRETPTCQRTVPCVGCFKMPERQCHLSLCTESGLSICSQQLQAAMTATTIVSWACALMVAFHGRSPPDRLADQHRYTTHSLAYPRANAARRRLVWPWRNRVFELLTLFCNLQCSNCHFRGRSSVSTRGDRRSKSETAPPSAL